MIFFYTSREAFYFFVLRLAPHSSTQGHVECLPDVSSSSFLLPLVSSCSHTSPECPAMFWASETCFFPVCCPKSSSFSFLHWIYRHTCCVLRVLVLLLCALNFKKLPLYPPPLFQLSSLCLELWLMCCPRLCLFIFDVFYLCISNWCARLVFTLPSLRLSHFNFQKLLIYVDLPFHHYFYCFQQEKPIVGHFIFFNPKSFHDTFRCQR